MHTIILTHFSLPGISTGSKYRYMFIVTSLYCQFLVGVFNFEFLTVGSSHFLSVYQTPKKLNSGPKNEFVYFLCSHYIGLRVSADFYSQILATFCDFLVIVIFREKLETVFTAVRAFLGIRKGHHHILL